MAPVPTPAASRSAAAPAPAAVTAPAARTPSGEIGSAAPIVVEAVARDGGWVVFCQARGDTDGDGVVAARVGPGGVLTGDALERFLALGAGAGERVDDLLAADATGRWVVVARDGGVRLLDTHRGNEVDLLALGMDARDDALSFRTHRALAFDSTGARLAYLRGVGRDTRVVVRDLSTGAETVLDPGGSEVWRIAIDPTDRFVVAHVLLADTNRDRRITWPAPTRKGSKACRSPVPRYDAWVGHGDEPTVRLLPLSGGSAETVIGYVTTLGSGIVIREPGGRLVLREPGTVRQLAPETCGARVALVDHRRAQLLVACTRPKGRPKLELLTRAGAVPLDADVAHQTQDVLDAAPDRLYALYPGTDTKLLDLERRQLTAAIPGDLVLATHGARALIQRRAALLILDVETGREHALGTAVAGRVDVLTATPWVAATPLLVNLGTGQIAGTFTGRPLALSPDGQVLVARGGDADGDRLAIGPLVWRAPLPPSPVQP